MSKCHKHNISDDLYVKVCPACFGEWHSNEFRLEEENRRLLRIVEAAKDFYLYRDRSASEILEGEFT